MIVILFVSLFKRISLYKKKCLVNINKLYNNSGICDEYQNFKLIIE